MNRLKNWLTTWPTRIHTLIMITFNKRFDYWRIFTNSRRHPVFYLFPKWWFLFLIRRHVNFSILKMLWVLGVFFRDWLHGCTFPSMRSSHQSIDGVLISLTSRTFAKWSYWPRIISAICFLLQILVVCRIISRLKLRWFLLFICIFVIDMSIVSLIDHVFCVWKCSFDLRCFCNLRFWSFYRRRLLLCKFLLLISLLIHDSIWLDNINSCVIFEVLTLAL